MSTIKQNILAGLMILSLVAATPKILYAQTGFVGDSLSYDNASARSTGLADADIADASQLISYNTNPALLSFASNPRSIHLGMYQDWRNNFSHFDISSPVLKVTRNIRSIIRLSYSGSYLSAINPTASTETAWHNDPTVEPEPDLTQYQLENATSFKISRVFSTGILQTLSFSNNANAQYWTYNAKAGLFYDPVGSLSYAALVSGLGRGTSYRFIEDGTTVLGSYNIPVKFEIGASFSFPEDTDDPDFILSLSNEKRFGEEGVWYKGGMEIKFLKHLFVRSGIQFQPELDYYMPRFGIGFKSNLISFDYGLAPGTQSKIDGRYHQLGLTIHL